MPTPEQSDFTSIQLRINAALNNEQPQALAKFIGNPRQQMPKGLPFALCDYGDYLQLVDLTGRCLREHKDGWLSYIDPPSRPRKSN